MFYDSWLGIPVKLDSETCDSFISVIPAKAGIQNRSMPQKDLDTKTPWIPAFAGMTCNLTTLPRNSRFRRNPVTTTVAGRSDCGDACIPPVEKRDRRRNDGNKAVIRLGIQLDDNPKLMHSETGVKGGAEQHYAQEVAGPCKPWIPSIAEMLRLAN